MASPIGRSPKQQRRRTQHRELNRNQVLDAAEEVFGEKGYDRATLKEVAERAGFAVGSVYLFFDNKSDLFRQLFVRRGIELLDDMVGVLSPPGDALAGLHALVDVQVDFFRRHAGFGRLYFRYSAATNPSVHLRSDRAASDEYDRAMAMEADLFARGQADGVFVDGEPAALASLFSGMMSAFHAIDAEVVEADERTSTGAFSLDELHAMVERAFT